MIALSIEKQKKWGILQRRVDLLIKKMKKVLE